MFLTKEEGAAFFHWCLTQWEEYYILFLPTDENQDDNEDKDEDNKAQLWNLCSCAQPLACDYGDDAVPWWWPKEASLCQSVLQQPQVVQ